FQMSLQECVDGEVYYFAQRDHADFISPRFMEDLATVVSLSHEAKLYDIDLHAMNVMVDRQAGTPKLFDFNQIPFTERPEQPVVRLALRVGLVGRAPQRPFVGLVLRRGLLGRGSRDLRKLARFQNYDRVERKLLKFYEESRSPG